MKPENNIKLNYSLFPFSFLYGIGVGLRNFLFNKEFLSSTQYPIPVICIGNLSVGGTGKTPHTEHVVNLLKENYKVAVLSRGYKRKTKGYLLANENSTSKTIGDEPFQIKKKFPEILVAVDENRRRGIKNLLALNEEERPDVIILDDGFQHRHVTPSLSVVLTDYNRLFYLDKLLPVGQLREPGRGVLRADAVIVTKCDNELKPIDFRIIEENMELWAHQAIYFTRIVYGEIQPLFPEEFSGITSDRRWDKIVLVSGIAKPDLFVEEARKYAGHVDAILFPDHHNFRKKDIKRINEALAKANTEDKIILTTEKDAARLLTNKYLPEEWKKLICYMPIAIDFCSKNYKPFDELIIKHVKEFKKNRI